MEKGGSQLTDAPSFVDLCTLHQHAMRYYRLWIYACNTVLALATLIFTLCALSVFVDPRISLLSGVELYQPTFLYAYVALLLQCGVIQAIGCVGALRLNQKLLNTYWILLVVLMIGDIFVGLVWTFRLDRIKSNLIPDLKQRLNNQYGIDPKFTQVWDWVQSNEECCGVESPPDFIKFNDSFSIPFDSNGQPLDITLGFHRKLPWTCCVFNVSYYQAPVTPPTTLTPKTPSSKHIQQHQLRSNRVNVPHYPTSFGTHNRRKILHSTRKHDGRGPDPSQFPHHQRPHVQTTTESNRRGTPFGVCGLPPNLLHMVEANNNNDNNDNNNNYNHVYIRTSDNTLIDISTFLEGSGGGSHSSEEFSAASSSTELPTSSSSPIPFDPSSRPFFTTEATQEFPSSSTQFPHYLIITQTLKTEGCGEKILNWVDNASDILYVIGFCIIVFLKACFVTILRYEIKEMIQKIKLLNGDDEGRTAAMNELIGLTSLYEQEDQGEREGLMADHIGPESNTSTNLDAIESDKRKDSGGRRPDEQNCLVGNHVGNHKQRVPLGNHIIGIGSNNTSSTTPTSALKGGRGEPEAEEDFDGKSALLGKQLRNENGGRNLPRNGNNNASSPGGNAAGLGGVTGSASAPIPIDSMAKA